VFALVLLGGSGTFDRAPSFGKREASRLAAAMSRYEAVLSAPDKLPRPFPSRGNDATADYLAARFRAFRLEPYRRDPGHQADPFCLETRAMIPVSRTVPVLQLLAADGSVLRTYRRGRDFLETTAGCGGGGRAKGAYQMVTAATDTMGSLATVACLRKTVYRPADEAQFVRRGAKALLIEGDPALAPGPDYSDEKNSQLLKHSTLLRFLVAPEVMAELAEAAPRGAQIRAEWAVRFDWAYPRSVIGGIPGRDTARSSELIVATALDTPQAEPGSMPALAWFLALAEVLAEQHLRPRHSIVFAAFNGTRTGHLGAQGYLEAPAPFQPSNQDAWLGGEDSPGLIAAYFQNLDRASGRFATGRHVLNLASGSVSAATLYQDSERPWPGRPGHGLARDLAGLAHARGVHLVPARPDPFDTQVFSANGNSAATLVLPAALGRFGRGPGGPEAMAGILARFIQIDAVAPAPTPVGWLLITGKALLAGLGAALVAGWLLRRWESRRAGSPDPYTQFLKRPVV
jgi:hypothetical protein